MSTRSNVLIKMGDTKIYLYRHSDGYPGANGADLAERLIKHKNHGKAFINDLLAERYDATEYRPERPVWELTNGLHGDIEWLYVFEMADGDFYDIPVLVKVIVVRFVFLNASTAKSGKLLLHWTGDRFV